MDDREFRRIFEEAQSGNEESTQKLLEMFKPLIYQNSFINGRFDEDCFQELNIKLLKCIKSFKFHPNKATYECFQKIISVLQNDF